MCKKSLGAAMLAVKGPGFTGLCKVEAVLHPRGCLGASRTHLDLDISECSGLAGVLSDVLFIRGRSFDCRVLERIVEVSLEPLLPGYLLAIRLPHSLEVKRGRGLCYLSLKGRDALYLGL